MKRRKGKKRRVSRSTSRPCPYPPVIIKDLPSGLFSDAFELHRAVRAVGLKLADRDRFQPWQRDFFKRQAASSFEEAIVWFTNRWLTEGGAPHDWSEIRSVIVRDERGEPRTGPIPRDPDMDYFFYCEFLASVGHALAEAVNLVRFETVVPMVMFNASPIGTTWQVTFEALPSINFAPINCGPPWQTRISVDGSPLAVGGHFVTRLCNRLWPDWQRYGGALDAHRFLKRPDWLRGEPTRLLDGQEAVSIWKEIVPGMLDHENAVRISGIEPGEPLWLRLGYAPVRREGDLLVAQTFLLTGFERTREARCMNSGPTHIRTLARELTAEGTRRRFSIGGPVIQALTWLHRNGAIEQVRKGWPSGALPAPSEVLSEGRTSE